MGKNLKDIVVGLDQQRQRDQGQKPQNKADPIGLYFIDFQSGRRGALQYDTASLLYDAYIYITEENRYKLLEYYLDCAGKSINYRNFMFYFKGFAFIRILQALGAFGFLGLVKNKRHFLKSVPTALAHVETLLSQKTIVDKCPELCRILYELAEDEQLRGL